MGFMQTVVVMLVLLVIGILVGLIVLTAKCYRKARQGQALIRTGSGGTVVSFTGKVVYPILHRMEVMDISVKRIEIERAGKDGLICRDNVRADIRVAFFVRVNKTVEDVMRVAQSLGCDRASDPAALIELFDAKFSEALKTIGKRFDFVELYTDRERFKEAILQAIGTDLNGYVLDDAAIDYLEQTPLKILNPENILDAEGIKKIVDLTAKQAILSNSIEREKQKTITKQDVEAREAILELERQLAETEEKQKREVLAIKAREQAEVVRVQQEEKLKAERARIATEEEVRIAEEQKERQIIVAQRNKERTDKVEIERVEKDRALESVERERVVELSRISKEKAVEQEKKLIQEVIRERVIVEKATVQEEERIKDTRAHMAAEREKQVKVISAEAVAQEAMVKRVKAAEAERAAAELEAKQHVIEAEADMTASEKKALAMKTLADAHAAEEAVRGMSEVNVMKARAEAIEQQGAAEANVLEKKAFAEARGLEAKAAAVQKQGEAEANVLAKKYSAEAEGITQKADAMRKLDGVGKDHEEFKLRLDKEKSVELAQINIQKDIANAQAQVIGEALRSAKIDIIGGETMFFDKIVGSITLGKQVDGAINHSKVLGNVKDTLLVGDGEHLAGELKRMVGQFGLRSEDLKNISIAALIADLMHLAEGDELKGRLSRLLDIAKQKGLADKPASILPLK